MKQCIYLCNSLQSLTGRRLNIRRERERELLAIYVYTYAYKSESSKPFVAFAGCTFYVNACCRRRAFEHLFVTERRAFIYPLTAESVYWPVREQ